MSKVLCTFSGSNGDILWSLPTARAISQMVGEKVDFAIMPEYRGLLDLIGWQPYIDKACTLKDWKCEGSPHGNQPWMPPANALKGYERCFHLTYRSHPGIGGKRLPLIDFIADQQGIKFVENPLPFLKVGLTPLNVEVLPYIALAFNDLYDGSKLRFLETLRKAKLDTLIVDVKDWTWLNAATLIKHAVGFIGCRSANNVLAHGVGQKNIFIYEPHPSRRASGNFGDVFGCPYNTEITMDGEPEDCAKLCIEMISKWREQKEKELHEIAQTFPR